MKNVLLMLVILVSLVSVSPAVSLDASGDTMIWGYADAQKATNYGSLERFSMNTVAPAGGSYCRGLVEFDLSGITPDQVVDGDVTLKLTQKDDNPTYYNFFVYESLKDWDESTVTWNSFSDDDVAGPTAGVDYGTDLLALYDGLSIPTQFGGPVDGTVHNISLPADVINGWIADPSSNKGLYLAIEVIGATQSSGWLSFWSEEDASGRGPVLEFNTIPEPMTLGLLGIGTLIGLHRRK